MNILYNDKDKKNTLGTAEELLQDEFFIASMIRPTEQSETSWRRRIADGNIDGDNYRFARFFVNAMQVRSETIDDDEKEAIANNIRERLRNRKKRRINLLWFFSIAASVAVALSAGTYWYFKNTTDKSNAIVRIEDVKAPDIQSENIQIMLSGDKIVSLEGEEADIVYHEGKIEINSRKSALQQPETADRTAYNHLIVPKGKRSSLTLADGTKIWVNASSRVVYPVTFEADRREIYVDGEAFMEVAQIENSPFTVKTKTFNAEVLGTSFNVMAYENDVEKSLVLVTGSVKIHVGEAKTDIPLIPGEMFTSFGDATQVQTVQTEYYTSWKSGMYQYESEPLYAILKRLSRYYGEEIVCDPTVAMLKCSGKLDLKDKLSDVLKGIALTAPVRYKSDNEINIITNH